MIDHQVRVNNLSFLRKSVRLKNCTDCNLIPSVLRKFKWTKLFINAQYFHAMTAQTKIVHLEYSGIDDKFCDYFCKK